MNEVIESKINELYNILMEKPMKILEIFNDFFGEERVDMQGFIDIENFKLWLSEATISNYLTRTQLGISYEDWCNCNDKPVTELDGEILNTVLLVLGSRDAVIESIRRIKFNSGFIIVHFPHVRVTNEYDRFTDINHLYAKITFNSNGLGDGYFSLNRADYSFLHISHNYMHSHVGHIPFTDFTKFQTPCTGSGPINHTLASLTREFDEELWQLLCLELDKYVQVESIEGTPYHRLESLGSSTSIQNERFIVLNNIYSYIRYFDSAMARNFITHLIHSKKLKYNYNFNSYSIGMSYTEFIITVSNEFIKWYNKEFNKGVYYHSLNILLSRGILKKCIISENKIFYKNNNTSIEEYRGYVGKRICTFKGKDVLISINDLKDINENNESTILNPEIALYLLTRILNVLNYRYGKSKQRDPEDAGTSEKVKYI